MKDKIENWIIEKNVENEQKFDLIGIVKQATWKDLLIDLVRKNKIDPWNIDLIAIIDSYIQAVREMQMLDLTIPANIILAASILLRLKSQMLFNKEENEEPKGQEVVNYNVEIPELSLRIRIPPKRKVTLVELLNALEEAMKIKENFETIKKEEIIPININIDNGRIEEIIDETFNVIKSNKDKDNLILFSTLIKRVKVDDILLKLFIPIIILANRGMIELFQDEFFGEIIIKVR